MTPPSRADIHRLLSEREWLVRLARRLLGDGPDADDLAQETLSRALQSGTVPARPRGWLFAVARNLRLESRRSDARRRAREEEASKPEAGSDGDAFERASLRHKLLEHVLTLPETERSAIILRYLEDLSYEEVAAREKVSVVAVRKRVSRAIERLRGRLDSAEGGRGVWAELLVPLVGPRPSMGLKAGATTAPLTITLGAFAMSIQFKLALGCGVVAALAFLAVTRSDVIRPEAGVGAAKPPAASALIPGDNAAASDQLNAGSREPGRHNREGARSSSIAEEPGDPEEPIDRYARETLRIHVTDRAGANILGAAIRVTGYRSEGGPGDTYGWRKGSPQVKTNTAGIAELDYPVWKRDSERDWVTISTLMFATEHPLYSTRQSEASVESEEAHVVLEYGSTVIVSGWINSPTERILNLSPLVGYDPGVKHQDWEPVRDGRLSCNRIPPGHYVIVLQHDRDGVPYCTAGVEFDLGEDEQKELHLQLHPPRRIRGSLDAQVPRPVEHGQVRVAVGRGSRERRAVLMNYFSATVAPDGSFELKDLPPGEIEIIALCDGWASVNSPSVDHVFVRRTQVVPEDHEGEFLLRMEPAASLEVKVLDPSGNPLEGAVVQMIPTVRWKRGAAEWFARSPAMEEVLRRRWRVGTDGSGLAILANLPPKNCEGVMVIYSGLRLPMAADPWGAGRRRAWVELKPGEVARLTVQLEEGED